MSSAKIDRRCTCIAAFPQWTLKSGKKFHRDMSRLPWQGFPHAKSTRVSSLSGLPGQSASWPEWDNEFLDRLERDPQSLVHLTHRDSIERRGAQSVEMVMWFAMRSALGADVRRVHRHYFSSLCATAGRCGSTASSCMTSRVTVASRWIITGIPMGVYTGSIQPPRSIHSGDDGGGNGPLAFGLALRHEAACAKPPRFPRSSLRD